MFTVKVISTIVLLGIFAILNVISFSPANDPQGIVFIELIDEYGNLVEYKEIEFTNQETLLEILQENFILNTRSFSFGTAIIGINNIQTDFQSSYIAIYINNEYSTMGVELIPLIDETTYSFRKENI